MQRTLRIPIPRKVAGTKKGIYSTGHMDACDNKVRFSPYDTELIDRAAILCDIVMPTGKPNRSAFIRWCAVYAANEVLNNVDIANEGETYDF